MTAMMKTRVLVTAATRHGSTMEIAEAIGRTLGEQGFPVTVEAVDSVSQIDAYEAIVIGSGVYMGRWLEPARTFVDRHAVGLRDRPTWLFSSGPIGDPPRPDVEDAVNVDELMAATGAKGHRLFAGKIDRHRLGFGERALLRAVGAKDGDYREWDAISGWALAIARALEQ
jgi:menaquinone-dependent protoporphyrinogen oxidase